MWLIRFLVKLFWSLAAAGAEEGRADAERDNYDVYRR
jgi:hypothetical protein